MAVRVIVRHSNPSQEIHRKAEHMRKLNFFTVAVFMLALAVAMPSALAKPLKPLHQFNGDTQGDGANPFGALLLDAAGNLYGTTLNGGTGDGTVFKIDSTGKETVLFTFDSAVSGDSPDTPLIQDQAGNLYGITSEGGPGGAFGIVYKLSPQGEQTVLHAFHRGAGSDPLVPTGGLLMDSTGNIFGTTIAGGSGDCPGGCGTVFRLDPALKLRVLHKFTVSEGNEPFGPLVQDADGNLYGVTKEGGDLSCPDPNIPGAGCGTVFKLGKNRELTVLHTFAGGKDGSTPQGGLLLDAAGNLYGVASLGGNREHGTVFKISKDGAYTVLHRFHRLEGGTPNGGLVQDEVGNLYGTNGSQGSDNLGTIYQLSRDGQLTLLHTFRGSNDGAEPFAGLIRDAAGNLYGTTVTNLLNQRVNGGNVFLIAP